ncbi:MAG TPA: stage II sporulation protein M, partial [Bacteroidia bacterium]|nr:stage II sporulation protein M [Bacteroidia bacterium]
MKEITFLKQNYEQWQKFEDMLNSPQGSDPDALADLFVRITDDLSWAHTFYPGSNTEKYLNDLAARIHQEIYKNKKEKRARLFRFWTNEIPDIMSRNRKNLLIAFLLLAVSAWIGVISSKHDTAFVRLILGDGYVDLTLENMARGDPMGIYKDENAFLMFFQIALNNSYVALVCILAGMFNWLGVGYIL